MKIINHITTFILLIIALQGVAQERMTLQQCRAMALQKNENLKVAGKQLEMAGEQKRAARTLRLPGFSATATGIWQDKDFDMELMLPTQVPNPETGRLEPNLLIDPSTGFPVMGADGNPLFNMYAWMPLNVSLSGAYVAGITLEQPIYTGGKISTGNRMANIAEAMAGDNLSLQEMNALVEADHGYWTFVSVNQKVALARKALEMVEQLVEKVRNAYEVGMAGQNDLLKAQVEHNRAKLNLQKAQNGLELSRMDLCRITGLPLNTGIVPVDSVPEVIPPELTLAEDLLGDRPEYRLMQKQVDLLDQKIRMEKANFLPEAGFQTGYSRIGGIEFSDTKFSNTGFHAMASVKIPIFHWGEGVRKVNAAKIEKEIGEIELEKNRQLLYLETEQARLNLQLAYERIFMNETALEQAEENLRITTDNYEVGMETITNMLIAQTQWQEVYSELIDAKADYKKRETSWLKATGRIENP